MEVHSFDELTVGAARSREFPVRHDDLMAPAFIRLFPGAVARQVLPGMHRLLKAGGQQRAASGG